LTTPSRHRRATLSALVRHYQRSWNNSFAFSGLGNVQAFRKDSIFTTANLMQNTPSSAAQVAETSQPGGSSAKRWLATITCATAVAYTAGIVFGFIPQERRIDATNLLILGVAMLIAVLLVKPDALDQLKRFKVAGFELEIEKIKRSQELQQGQLEAISLILPLVLKDAEAEHLRNLGYGKTADYEGGHAVRTEVRRLATMGLVDRIEGKMVREMKDNTKFDLANYVRLTVFGRRMVAQLEEIEKAKLDRNV
jgi:hypothetical protein